MHWPCVKPQKNYLHEPPIGPSRLRHFERIALPMSLCYLRRIRKNPWQGTHTHYGERVWKTPRPLGAAWASRNLGSMLIVPI